MSIVKRKSVFPPLLNLDAERERYVHGPDEKEKAAGSHADRTVGHVSKQRSETARAAKKTPSNKRDEDLRKRKHEVCFFCLTIYQY